MQVVDKGDDHFLVMLQKEDFRAMSEGQDVYFAINLTDTLVFHVEGEEKRVKLPFPLVLFFQLTPLITAEELLAGGGAGA